MIFTLICILASTGSIYAEIDRNRIDGDFSRQFSVINYGRLYHHTVVMYLEEIDHHQCMFYCISHLSCVTVTYSTSARLCELNDMEFNDLEADLTADGWINYGTPPKIDGGYSEWKMIEPCSRSCDEGTASFYRTCDNPKPSFGGDKCHGEEMKVDSCNIQPCLICYDAKNNENGTIIVGKSGLLKEIKLIHITGQVSCYPDCYSKWGCCNPLVFRTVVRDSNQNVIFPETLPLRDHYFQPDQDSKGKVLHLRTSKKVKVREGELLTIYYSELGSKVNNDGRNCINVELIYA